MPIIPTVGRKSPKAILTFAALYIALSLGAVTMVYPFLTMVLTGMTSNVEQYSNTNLPRYLQDEKMVFAKFAEDKFADSGVEIGLAYGQDVANSAKTEPPDGALEKQAASWYRFVARLGPEDYNIGFRVTPTRPISLLNERYQEHCTEKFGGDLARLNRAFNEENYLFQTLEPPADQLHRRDFAYKQDAKVRDWIEYKQTLPVQFRIPVSGCRIFQEFVKGQYNGDIAALNKEWGTSFAYFQQIPLYARPPQNPAARAKWEKCLREKIPYRYLLLNGVRADYGVDMGDALQRVALQERVAAATTGDLLPNTPEIHFARTHGLKAEELVGIQAAADWRYVREHMGELRKEFATRNYRFVVNYILLHGRAVWVTVIFCVAMVLSQLIVNPLCAYALSRYPMRSTARILMFLLATMAFPAEVALIPSFLLLKTFGLLNTYWALVLPGVASGFAIFLLKGFFDSLPKELYEAGTMDGASELKMFARVTLPLSKPIFAVIALQGFLGAYGAFMYAFLVCQNPKMWTIMVWLYELQVRAPKFVIFAALTVAALPSLVVFLLAQNVIMRGIILPSEK